MILVDSQGYDPCIDLVDKAVDRIHAVDVLYGVVSHVTVHDFYPDQGRPYKFVRCKLTLDCRALSSP